MSANFNRSVSRFALMIATILCGFADAAEIPWSTNIEASLNQASVNGRPVLMEFTADWCVFCKKMEKSTFTNVDVAQRISGNFVAVRVDADRNKDLVKDLGIKGLPAILIVSPDLRVIKRISGFQTPDALIPQLDEVIGAHQSQTGSTVIAKSPTPQQRQISWEQQKTSGSIDTNRAVATSSETRGELEFEAISQEEAPRAGAPPSRARVPANSSNDQFVDVANKKSEQPAAKRTASSESESFFQTISREEQPLGDRAASVRAAFGGLCIVSAVENRELVPGISASQVKYRGQTLYFSDSRKKQQFLAAPATYWPMLDGACAMTLLKQEKQVEGSLEFAAVFRKRIWLFTSQEAMQEFLRDPADVAEEATELAAELQR